MLATLVIGLREGLEAALIVGIIAAFLRKNGRSLAPMWLGVGIAVLISLAVGLTLGAIEQALPQAAQEGMETIIGAVAIVFVTSMIVWMNTHARGMKRELEAEATSALSRGGSWALVAMAFLAVLKEGFETSVFLLATFSAAQSTLLAAAGAVAGIGIAVIIGWGIYAGGVRLNLSRFFRATGGFLILVAAGLVVSCLRTAHEAGWLNAGQQQLADLSGLVQPGSIQAALLTGVLGIPADPRLIEVIGWFAYLVPTGFFVFWPQRWRPRGSAVWRSHIALAIAIAATALVLALAVPHPDAAGNSRLSLLNANGDTVATAALETAGQTPTTVTISSDNTALPLDASAATPERHSGVNTSLFSFSQNDSTNARPSIIDLKTLMSLNGGKLPVGLNAAQNPGPFAAQWKALETTDIWISGASLIDAKRTVTLVLTVTGGGLTTPRTLSFTDPAASWQASPQQVATAADAAASYPGAVEERQFWAVYVPVILAVLAVIMLIAGIRARRRQRADDTDSPLREPEPVALDRPSAP